MKKKKTKQEGILLSHQVEVILVQRVFDKLVFEMIVNFVEIDMLYREDFERNFQFHVLVYRDQRVEDEYFHYEIVHSQ